MALLPQNPLDHAGVARRDLGHALDAPPAAAPPLPEEVVAGGLPVQDLPGPRDPEALGRSSMRLLFHAYPCALMCRRRLRLLRGRLLLDGRDHHHHVAPVELRELVYGSNSL